LTSGGLSTVFISRRYYSINMRRRSIELCRLGFLKYNLSAYDNNITRAVGTSGCDDVRLEYVLLFLRTIIIIYADEDLYVIFVSALARVCVSWINNIFIFSSRPYDKRPTSIHVIHHNATNSPLADNRRQ